MPECRFRMGRVAGLGRHRRAPRSRRQTYAKAIRRASHDGWSTGVSRRVTSMLCKLSVRSLTTNARVRRRGHGRFYALRVRDAGFIKSTPQMIIADGTDWRFLDEVKRELKA